MLEVGDVDDIADQAGGAGDRPEVVLGPALLAGARVEGVEGPVIRAEVDGRLGVGCALGDRACVDVVARRAAPEELASLLIEAVHPAVRIADVDAPEGDRRSGVELARAAEAGAL